MKVPCELLPHRVDIQSCTLFKDTVGQRRLYPPEGGSTKKAKLKCLVEPLATEKVIELLRLGFQATHRVYFAEAPGLVATDRIVFKGRKFEPKGEVDVLELGVLFVVNCEEVK